MLFNKAQPSESHLIANGKATMDNLKEFFFFLVFVLNGGISEFLPKFRYSLGIGLRSGHLSPEGLAVQILAINSLLLLLKSPLETSLSVSYLFHC